MLEKIDITKQFAYIETDLIDKYIRVIKSEPCEFMEGTLAMVSLRMNDGIYALVGTTIGDGSKRIQSYLFEKNSWTENECAEWVQYSEVAGEPLNMAAFRRMKEKIAPKIMPEYFADLKELKGVEIFSVGKWNGDVYSLDDLKEMVEAFPKLKQTLQPYVKLGHNEDQPLLAKDGLPAAGWVENIYIHGNKLLADIKDMPQVIYELIKNKAYKRVSSEIYWNMKDASGQIYKRVLKAIALLGGDTPAVGNLADVQVLYSKRELKEYEGELKVAEIEYYTKEDIMELEQLKAENAELRAKISEFEKSFSDLQKAKEDADAKVAQYEFDKLKSDVERKVTDLISRKKLLPAQRQYVIDILMSDTKKYTIDENPVVKMFEVAQDVVETKELTKDDTKLDDLEIAGKIAKASNYAEAKKIFMEGVK